MRDEVLERAVLKEVRGVKILRLAGSPYEMGYQHGRQLAEDIDLMVDTTLAATAAYVALQTGSELERAEEMLWIGQRRAEPHLPKELEEEIAGIADGVRDAGGKATFEEILLWNTNYDQWCIYCHPHYWNCEGDVADEGERVGPAPPAPPAGGCSSFSAWGDGQEGTAS